MHSNGSSVKRKTSMHCIGQNEHYSPQQPNISLQGYFCGDVQEALCDALLDRSTQNENIFKQGNTVLHYYSLSKSAQKFHILNDLVYNILSQWAECLDQLIFVNIKKPQAFQAQTGKNSHSMDYSTVTVRFTRLLNHLATYV